MQSWHYDFCPSRVKDEQAAGGLTPFTVLVALSPRCSLFVRGSEAQEVKVNLSAGDAIIFDGDVAHAGDTYAELNFRAHWYVESKHLKSKHKSLLHIPVRNYFLPGLDAKVGEITHVL